MASRATNWLHGDQLEADPIRGMSAVDLLYNVIVRQASITCWNVMPASVYAGSTPGAGGEINVDNPVEQDAADNYAGPVKRPRGISSGSVNY